MKALRQLSGDLVKLWEHRITSLVKTFLSTSALESIGEDVEGGSAAAACGGEEPSAGGGGGRQHLREAVELFGNLEDQIELVVKMVGAGPPVILWGGSYLRTEICTRGVRCQI